MYTVAVLKMASDISTMDDSHDLDLPLMSNLNDIHVKHYILDLLCDFDAKVFSGSITLFCTQWNDKAKTVNLYCTESLAETQSEPQKSRTCLSSSGDNVCGNDCSILSKPNFQTCVPVSKDSCHSKTAANNLTIQRIELNIPREDDNLLKKVPLENSDSKQDQTHITTEVHVPAPDHTCLNHGCGEHLERSDSHLVYEERVQSKLEDETIKSQCHVMSRAENVDETRMQNKTVLAESDNHEIMSKHLLETEEQAAYLKDFSTELKGQSKDVVMVLDSWDLQIESVDQVFVASDALTSLSKTNYANFKDLFMSKPLETEPLNFCNEKKCLKVWKDGLKNWNGFPGVIRIQYKTRPSGQSLKWTLDQDGRPCVYTHGHWINNRSLFPSQDVPVAMATWSADIQVAREAVVLMSGDKNPQISEHTAQEGYKTYHYSTSMEMPSSTLALAVGHWPHVDIVEAAGVTEDRPVLPCRLFSARGHLATAQALLADYLPRCMEAAQWLLGPHPFSRLDILLVPSSFASLGMASPSLMFLSQSVLSGTDGGMLVRVAHELSHSWFGLLIGPRDWHEEWLSEGFCTYTEGVIHARCMQWTEEEMKQNAQLQDYLKYQTLVAEINTTEQELQTLRHEEETSAADGVTYVKNGMNPDKGFMQVHYLKGYFLLRFLEDRVGQDNFRMFLRDAVKKFHHQLITSDDVFTLFLKMFPQDQFLGITRDTMKEWLDKPGLPPELHQPRLEDIAIAKPAVNVVGRIRTLQKTYSKLHWRKRQKLDLLDALRLPELSGGQVLILLELLLDEDKLHPDILTALNLALKLSTSYPDILHRWCELVVKHRVEAHYGDVEQFLINHQAMGVYLFGELMVTRDAVQRRLAQATFDKIRHDMEEGARKTVSVMLYG